MNKYIATITNLAFTITALALWSLDILLWATALTVFLMTFASAIHHYNLVKEFMDRDTSRDIDYFGMYFILSSLAVAGFSTISGLYLYGLVNLAVALPLSLFLIFVFKSSRTVIGIGVGVVLVFVAVIEGFTPLPVLLGWLAIAFVGNMLGDRTQYHQIWHGLWWHVVINAPIFLVAPKMYGL